MTTGEIKEASIWMRMKCAIGITSAKQKVANLVDAVRTTLLDAVGAAKDSGLDTDISGIKLTEFVKGSDILDIAGRFSKANEQKIVKREAEAVIKDVAKLIARNVLKEYPDKARSLDLVTIAKHALKSSLARELPVKRSGGSNVLDKDAFIGSLAGRKFPLEDLLGRILNSGKLGDGKLDPYYAKYVVKTLFNEDGTESGKTVEDLKTLSQAHVDTAFKIGQGLTDNRGEIVTTISRRSASTRRRSSKRSWATATATACWRTT